MYLSLPKFPRFAAGALQDSRGGAARVFHERGAGLSPCARNTIREAISRDTLSSQHAGHADTLSEETARAAQLAPSAVTAGAVAEDLPPEVWLAESLRRRAAHRRARVITRRWTSRSPKAFTITFG